MKHAYSTLDLLSEQRTEVSILFTPPTFVPVAGFAAGHSHVIGHMSSAYAMASQLPLYRRQRVRIIVSFYNVKLVVIHLG